MENENSVEKLVERMEKSLKRAFQILTKRK